MVQLTNPEGDIESCRMSKELVQMLKHPECDATVRQQVLKAVFEGKNNIPDEKIPEAKISDENECSAASGASCNSSSIGKVHNWTQSEEVLLITLRSDIESKFVGAKAHETLWNEIQKKMEKQGVKISVAQIINKWKNMKKRYKEVIDANNKTGNNAVSWKHYDKFNELYGNKASTKLQASYDSGLQGASAQLHAKPNEGENNIAKPSCSGKNSVGKSAKKRKRGDLYDIIEKINDNAQDSLIEIKNHNEKQLQKLDRFLDLYEKSISGKGKNDETD
ncbi:uncharacterized protein [Mytilus edulis]